MTMLAVTVTKQGAVLSQDSWLYEVGTDYHQRVANAGITKDFQASVESVYVGGGDPTSIVRLGEAMKIIPVPRFGMAIAGTGSFRFVQAWYFTLASLPAMDIADLGPKVPRFMRKLREQIATAETSIIVHAGYSPKRGAGCGFAYATAEDFEPQEIAIGETVAASPDPNEPDYPTIYDLYQHANRGERVCELHAALYAQQRRAFEAGMLGAGAAVGGDLHHVTVGRDGIDIRTAQLAA